MKARTAFPTKCPPEPRGVDLLTGILHRHLARRLRVTRETRVWADWHTRWHCAGFFPSHLAKVMEEKNTNKKKTGLCTCVSQNVNPQHVQIRIICFSSLIFAIQKNVERKNLGGFLSKKTHKRRSKKTCFKHVCLKHLPMTACSGNISVLVRLGSSQRVIVPRPSHRVDKKNQAAKAEPGQRRP